MDKTVFLIIDSSGEEAKAGLAIDSRLIESGKVESGPGISGRLLEQIDRMLTRNGVGLEEVGGVGVNVGPGKRSSSLRAGITTGAVLAKVIGGGLVEVKSRTMKDMISEVYGNAPVQIVSPDYDSFNAQLS